MRRTAVWPVVSASLALVLVCAAVALAQGSAGAGFSYNAGTGSIGLNVKNNSAPGVGIATVEVTLPPGTTIDGTPSGGGACTTNTPQTATCNFTPPKAPAQAAFVFINTDGAQPATVEVKVTFTDGSTADIVASHCGTVTVTTDSIPPGTQGQPYSTQFTAEGGTGPHTFSMQGALPEGVTLLPSGELSGRPARGGEFTFQVLASDANGCFSAPSKFYTLRVADAPTTPGISVEKRIVAPERPRRYDLVSFLVMVKNVGSTGTGALVFDDLLIMEGEIVADVWRDAAVPAGCGRAGDVLACSAGSLGPGQSAEFAIDVRLTRAGLYENSVVFRQAGAAETLARNSLEFEVETADPPLGLLEAEAVLGPKGAGAIAAICRELACRIRANLFGSGAGAQSTDARAAQRRAIGKATGRIRANRRGRLKLKLNRRGIRALRRAGALRATIRGRTTDRRGKRRKVSTQLVLRARGR